MGYLKTGGGGEGAGSEPPLNPPLVLKYTNYYREQLLIIMPIKWRLLHYETVLFQYGDAVTQLSKRYLEEPGSSSLAGVLSCVIELDASIQC